jgi:hypothetical protein
MPMLLKLFNHVDDAWEHDLRPWLEAGTKAALSGEKVWVVCRSFLQANWLRRRSMEERRSIIGIRFFDLRRLRRELCLYAGLPTPSFGRETLSLLVRARMDEAEASSAFTNQVLDALDDLAACGWLERYGADAALDLLQVPLKLRDPLRQITDSLLWRPRVDRALLEKAGKISGLKIGFFGLDARALHQQDLLIAAARASADAQFWLAQPIVSEEIFMRWVERLESVLDAALTLVPSEGAPRPYEDLVSRFVHTSGSSEKVPRLIRAERWSDQIRAVVAIVQEELAGGVGSLAVMVPEGSSTGPALVEALIAAGIAVADEFRSNALLDRSERVHRWLAEWVEGDRTPEKLLEFFNLLSRGPESFASFRKRLFDEFDRHQTRALDRLVAADFPYPWVRDLHAIGSDWPRSGSWSDLESRWRRTILAFKEFLLRHGNVLQSITISLEHLQPNWDEIQNTLGDLVLSARVFLRFIADSLASPTRASHPDASHRYAPVVVSTAEQLHGTSWDSVILVDGVGDRWTRLSSRDSLLGPEFRKSIRQQDFLLASLQEESLLREDTILQLLLHARRSATIFFYGKEENGEEVDAHRVITFLERSLHAEVEEFASFSIGGAADFPALRAIRESRCDPEGSFDEYLLDFGSLNLEPGAWSASELQTAIAAPGSFAFRNLFGLKRSWDLSFERDEHRTLGIVVHRLLAAILKNPFGELFQNRLSDLRQNVGLRATRDPTSRRYKAKLIDELDLPTDDLWWLSIVEKGFFLVETMLAEVDRLLTEFPYGASEHSTGELAVRSPQMNLKGRFDLLLAAADVVTGAKIAIIDFKTTNSLRQLKPETGEGFQLVAYRLLAEAMGAAACSQIAVMPAGTKDLSLAGDREAIEMKLTELASMQARSCFGHAPLVRVEFGIRENLPLATIPIPAWILRRKRTLSLG